MMTKPLEGNLQANVSRKWFALRVGLFALCCSIQCSVLLAAGRQVNFLAFGDWGADSPAEAEVASGMKTYLARHHCKPDAVLLLGDNFYIPLSGGVKDQLWKKLFEQMYDSNYLAAPFYAVLGNHDYRDNSAQVELDYPVTNPQSRFKMPSRWYRVDVPSERPLVTLLALDSNADHFSRRQWAEQIHWLETELSQPHASWTICFAHHPLFSDSAHGDDKRLQEDWGPLFRKYHVDFYLAGHDHSLQYLEMPGWSTSFIVSGGGGARLYPIERHRYAKYAASKHGFVRLEFGAGVARVSFVDKHGTTLQVFERNRLGKVTVLPVSP